MNFSDAVKTCYHKFFTLRGRACRSEYWWFVLFAFIANLILSFIAVFPIVGELAGFIGSLAILIPFISVSVRRMHDLEKSGLWLLFPGVLIVAAIFFVVFGALSTAGLLFLLGIILILAACVAVLVIVLLLAQYGSYGENRYGPDPFQEKLPFNFTPKI